MSRRTKAAPGRTIRACRDVIGLLTEYMEGGLSADEIRRLEAHLADCGPCVEFLETLKRSRDAVRTLQPHSVPEPCRRALRSFLRKEMKGRAPGPWGAPLTLAPRPPSGPPRPGPRGPRRRS